jgi:hypothetical protein
MMFLCFILFLIRVRIGFYGVLTCRLVDFLRTEIERERAPDETRGKTETYHMRNHGNDCILGGYNGYLDGWEG